MMDYGVDSDTDEETGMAYRQLLHNHSQLMQEKSRMEDYFDEVDKEVCDCTRRRPALWQLWGASASPLRAGLGVGGAV